MKYRIYYADGWTYDGDPFFAPNTGVQVVAQEDGSKVRIMSGKDAYYWKPESGWHACDTLGMWDYLFMYRGPKALLFGREMERDEEFFKLRRRALDEGVG